MQTCEFRKDDIEKDKWLLLTVILSSKSSDVSVTYGEPTETENAYKNHGCVTEDVLRRQDR